MVESVPRAFAKVTVPVQDRPLLLLPYDLSITLEPKIRLEIGRFSLGTLARVRVIANPDDELVLKIGAFCEISHDALVVVGGVHRNESLFNFTFGGMATILKHFMSAEEGSCAM